MSHSSLRKPVRSRSRSTVKRGTPALSQVWKNLLPRIELLEDRWVPSQVPASAVNVLDFNIALPPGKVAAGDSLLVQSNISVLDLQRSDVFPSITVRFEENGTPVGTPTTLYLTPEGNAGYFGRFTIGQTVTAIAANPAITVEVVGSSPNIVYDASFVPTYKITDYGPDGKATVKTGTATTVESHTPLQSPSAKRQVIPPPTGPNLVTNGGFETGNYTGWAVSGSGNTVVNHGAHTGTYAADFNSSSTGTLIQNIATHNGFGYTFTFYYSASATTTLDEGIRAYWNGGQLLAVTNSSFGSGYNLGSYGVTANSGATAIEFTGYNFSGSTYLDDVSVTANTPTLSSGNMSNGVVGQAETVTLNGSNLVSSGSDADTIVFNGTSYAATSDNGAGSQLSVSIPGTKFPSVGVYTAPVSVTSTDGTTNVLTLTYTVSKATSTVAISSSANPSTYGSTVTFTGTANPQFAGVTTPTGTETFVDTTTGATLGTPTLAGGSASVSVSSQLVSPSDVITVTYGGDVNFGASSNTYTETINKATPTITVVSSGNPSTYGTLVTFTATVKPPTTGTPTGTETFVDTTTGVTLGTVTLAGGSGSVNASTQLVSPSDVITVTYNGDSNFITASGSITETISKATTTITVTSSLPTSIYGQTVTFTGTVNPQVAGGIPSGTETFVDTTTGVTIGVATLAGGSGSVNASTQLVGPSDVITVTYNGDSNFSTSSKAITQTVNKASTTVTISSTVNASTYGQTVTFSATVSPQVLGTATGTETFVDTTTGVTLGTATLAGGSASVSASTQLVTASDVITVTYNGDANFSTSSALFTQTVNQASTTLTIHSSVNPSTFGQTVTFTATVTPQIAGVATGTVTFVDSTTGVTLGTGTLSGNSGSISASTQLVGPSDIITVTYNGDANFSTSSGVFTQTVNPAVTTLTIRSSANPSTYGQTVTFTATVTPGSSITPTGTVTFVDTTTGVTLGTATLAGGSGSVSASTQLVDPSDVITVTYGGDANFGTLSGSITEIINQATTTVTLGSSTNPSTFGQTVTFRATVNPQIAGTPTGTVTFVDSTTGVTIGTASLAGGSASVTTTALELVTPSDVITASYGGDANFKVSSTSLTQIVNTDATTTTVSSLTNPSSFGATVTFTATVSASAGDPFTGTPSGTVTFVDTTTGATLGTATLSGGSASVSASTQLVAPSDIVTVTYNGDANFSTSSGSVTQTINSSASTTIVAEDINPSTYGQTVTFSATVSNATVIGGGTPTGTVTFVDSTTGVTLGTGTLVGGSASVNAAAQLEVASDVITATYNGDANFTTSSGTTTETVNQANSAVVVSSSSNPSTFGQTVTFTATVSNSSFAGVGTPTGTVTFVDSTTGVTLGTQTLAGGSASQSASSELVASSDVITVTYSGDANFITSSGAKTQIVNPASTTVVVTSGPNSSIYGESVTIDATVLAQIIGTPTGTVTFVDQTTGVTLGTATLAGGSASVTANTQLVAPSDILMVTYGGETNFATSVGTTTQTVNQASSTTTITDSPNPSTYGQTVTLSVTVSPQILGQPTGTVTFVDTTTGATLGTATLSGASGTLLVSSQLVVSSDVLIANYNGDANFSTSSGTTTQTVNAASSATSVTSTPNPSTYGQTVTFSATVTNASFPGFGTPTGTVTFVDSTTGVTLGTGTLAGGSASVTAAAQLESPSDVITVTYSGDANFSTSTGTTTQTVNQATASVAVSSTVNPSTYSQTVTFSATVSNGSFPGVGTPTGTVTFVDTTTGATLGTQTLAGGSASQSASTELVGPSDVITVSYSGDANFTTSSGALTQTVNAASTSVSLATSVNPSAFGQTVTFTTTVSNASFPGLGTPSGTVTFDDAGSPLATVTLAGGSASFNTGALSVGVHDITVVYNGDANFATGTSSDVSQTVTQGPTAIALTSSLNPSVFSVSVTFSATVSAGGSSAGTPTGTVSFFDNGVLLATASLSGGVATLTTNSLAVGHHPIDVTYVGDANFTAATSGTLTQTVAAIGTTTSLTTTPNPSVYGQNVTFTATVSGMLSGTPTGMITFVDDGVTTIGSATLNGSSPDTATITYSLLNAGTQSITAVYSGDANFSGGVSPVYSQTVNKDATTTTLISSVNPSAANQAVTFTATVSANAPGSGFPSGNVTFIEDGTTTLGTVALNATSMANLTVTFQSTGFFSITASYTGDSNFLPSASPTLTQQVNKTVNISLGSNVDPAVFGQTVTFTAVISTSPAGGYSGTVSFVEGSTTLGTGSVSPTSGDASFTTTTLAVGTHSVIAEYSGNASLQPATSSVLSETVNPATTTTTVTSAPNPSTQNNAVTFTATVVAVSPGAGTPTGTVVFKQAGNTLGTGTLSGSSPDTATFTTSTLSVGTDVIIAVYGGDANFKASTSSNYSQTVQGNVSTTVVGSAPNPSTFGQSVTFSATVSGSLGTPTGTVTFETGATTLGTGTLNGSGVATLTTSSLHAGTDSITAVYGGSAAYGPSTSPVLNQTVAQSGSSTSVSSSNISSAFGQSVTFTATVSAVAPGGGTATGTVTFKNGSATLGTGTLNASDLATFTTSTLTVGSETVTAVYGGDANFSGSTSTGITQTVTKDGTTSTVSSSLNPSSPGQTVTFTATVVAAAPGAGTPTGTVAFLDGTTTLGTGSLSAADKASFTTSSLSAGTDSITGVYLGDANFAPSTSAVLSQTVGQASTTTTLSSTPNPTVFGQSTTFTATITVSSGTPTGTVTFLDGSVTLGTATVSSKTASLATTALPVGTDAITAVYSGDANFNGSTSAASNHTVNLASDTTSLSTSSSTIVFGQSVTFSTTITASSPGAGTPTGTVSFLDGTATLGTATLSGRSATFTTTALAVGTQSIKVVYGGDANFNASTSANLLQTVNQASTTTVLVSSGTSVFGQLVTFTMTVLPVSPGAGVPTGTVTLEFTLRGSVGTATLVNGTATITTSTLAEGANALKAVYNGDTNFLTDTSNTITQSVNPAGTSTTLVSSRNPSGSTGVTFTSTVTANAPGSGTPTGSVTFKDGTTSLGVGALNASGVATFTTSSLAVATHSITAVYNATTDYSTSTSPTLTQTVTNGPVALLATAPLATTSAASGFQMTVGAGSANLTQTNGRAIDLASTDAAHAAGRQESSDDHGDLALGSKHLEADAPLGDPDHFFATREGDTEGDGVK